MAAAARQMSGAAAGLPLHLDEAPNNSGSSSSSSSDVESDYELGDRTATAVPLDNGGAGRTDTSGLTRPGAQQRHAGAGGKGKRRRGRHQGIQEL